jgi:hypothetical protein
VRGGGAEDGRADRELGAVGPLDCGGARGVDLHDGEIAVAVDARDRAAGPAAISEGDGHLIAAQVVGVGQDRALGDHDAGAARAAADPDDGGADAFRDGRDGGLEFFDGGHVGFVLRVCPSLGAVDRRAIDL